MKTTTKTIILIGFASILVTSIQLYNPTHAAADNADSDQELHDAFDLHLEAYDQLFKETHKIPSPTPNQIAELEKKILLPAEEEYSKRIQKITERNSKQFEAESKKKADDEQQKQETETKKQIEKIFSKIKDPKAREKVRLEFNKSRERYGRKGIPLTPLNPSKNKISPIPSPTKNPAPEVEPEAPTQEPIDGSNIPKEIDFPGKTRKPATPSPTHN